MSTCAYSLKNLIENVMIYHCFQINNIMSPLTSVNNHLMSVFRLFLIFDYLQFLILLFVAELFRNIVI